MFWQLIQKHVASYCQMDHIGCTGLPYPLWCLSYYIVWLKDYLRLKFCPLAGLLCCNGKLWCFMNYKIRCVETTPCFNHVSLFFHSLPVMSLYKQHLFDMTKARQVKHTQLRELVLNSSNTLKQADKCSKTKKYKWMNAMFSSNFSLQTKMVCY